jgi:hypothetical protein
MIPCTFHPTVEATGPCAACGRPFCDGCLVDFLGRPLCGPCRDQRLAAVSGPGPGEGGTPPVWPWQVAYCATLAVVYLLMGILGVVMLAFASNIPNQDPLEGQITGAIYVALGFFFFALFAAAPFLPKQQWAWVYHIVLICLGMTSICCLPITVPLLIYWLKPETKRFFSFW